MSFVLNAIFSMTIGLSVVIGWIRFRKTDPAFFPFLLYVSAGLLNEGISIMVMLMGYKNVLNFTVFTLLESFLLTWQFAKWELFGRGSRLYYFIQILFLLAWVLESFVTALNTFDSYFIIFHSFLLVMMSISMINSTVLKDSSPIYQQPIFLLCMGLIVLFTYSVLVEAFWIVGLNHRKLFRLKIFEILSYVNLFTNLLFAFAFLWIPMKPRYILES